MSVGHTLGTLNTGGYGPLRPLRGIAIRIAPCNTQVMGFGSLRAIVTAGSSSTEEALGEVGSSVNRFATISGYIACLHETPRLRGSHQHHPPHHSHWRYNKSSVSPKFL